MSEFLVAGVILFVVTLIWDNRHHIRHDHWRDDA